LSASLAALHCRFGFVANLIVSVPSEDLYEALSADDGVEVVRWDLAGPPPRRDVDLVVQPYMKPAAVLARLTEVDAKVVQSQSIGYDGVDTVLPPGITYCNATGVHEASTAELAVALILASLRGFPAFTAAQAEGRWAHAHANALADKRVLVVGYGGVGRAVAARLTPFEVLIDRVATRARSDQDGPVHALDELPGLLREADVVVIAVPLTPSTTGMIDAGFLAAMKPGALLVNVARGQVAVTDDLVMAAQDGRVRLALDVTDPEPLPPGHPLWSMENVLITPHVGGDSTAMRPRVLRLIRAQLRALATGEPLINIVIKG
jgi:phosphoglycerate dehydrogenase-like enzyme